jgi:predicted metal-binding membrane protein
MQQLRHDRVFLPILLGTIGLAWLTLVVWGQSSYHPYLHHDALAEVDSGRSAGLLLVFTGGWTLMTVAMMLPTSLPLIALFQRMTANRPHGDRLVALVIAGYLVAWAAFGVVAHIADLGIHRLAGGSATLERHDWVIGAGVLLVAGLYQFAPLKHRCLDACRSPLSFIAARWSGRDEGRQSFLLGVQHGVFCVGCCWSLMLLLFLVGVGSIFWMLLLGAIMAVEKNMPWGRRISAPLGTSLVSAACAISLLAIV